MAIEDVGFVSCSIRGAPDVLATGTLFVSGPPSESNTIPLMMAAPPSKTTTLVINKTASDNAAQDLVINGALSSGVIGASGMQKGISLSMIRVPENFKDAEFNLMLKPQTISGVSSVAPLVILPGATPQSSSDTTIFMSGGTTSAPGDNNNNISLAIRNRLSQSGILTLSIEKDFNFSSNIPLQISSAISSGDMSLVAMGVSGQSSTMPLVVFDTYRSGVAPLYTDGFLE